MTFNETNFTQKKETAVIEDITDVKMKPGKPMGEERRQMESLETASESEDETADEPNQSR